MNDKPQIAIISLTADEGCQFAILDLGEKFLALTKALDITDFRLIEESKERHGYDICFVEGCCITKENKIKLLRAREKSQYLVALGACACLGSVPEIKNYGDRMRSAIKVYRHGKDIDNPPIVPLRDIVKVDFELPGCPIDGLEFLRICHHLINQSEPRLPQRPVCYECQIRGYACLLQRNQICLGPVSLGGCQAVCPGAGYACQGCRGLYGGANINNLRKLLQKEHDPAEINLVLEKFGLRDEWEQNFTLGKV